jgi:hypothetical protein
MSPIFPRFADLPGELRNQIWHAALPPNIGPALYLYRTGCISIREDPDYYYPLPIVALSIEFRGDGLGKAELTVPLWFVSREARSMVLPWLQAQQGVRIRHRDDDNRSSTSRPSPVLDPELDHRPCLQPIFVKAFDPERDTVYVPDDQWETFLSEPLNRLFKPGTDDRYYVMRLLPRVAVPVSLLKRCGGNLIQDWLEWQDNLREMLVVLGEMPDWETEGKGEKEDEAGKFSEQAEGSRVQLAREEQEQDVRPVRQLGNVRVEPGEDSDCEEDSGERVIPRWEYEDARQGTYTWNARLRSFLLEGVCMSRSVREDWFPSDVKEGIIRELESARMVRFEVRAVVAVRR